MRKGIYQDKNGTWYIHTKKNGRNITIRGYETKKQADNDYDFAIDRWFRTHNFNPNATTPLFFDISNNYIDYIRNGKASRTADREKTQLNTYWNIVFANDTIANIYNFERLKIIYSDIKTNNLLNIRKKHDLIYTFLAFTNYCYIQKLIDKQTLEETTIIFQPIKYTKTVQTPRKIAKKCEIGALLDAIPKNTTDYFMFSLLISCGLRISELLGLCNDCFMDNKVIVKRQLLTNGKISDKLKTQQSYRQIPLTKELQNLVSKHIIKSNNKKVFNISHTQFKRLLYKYEIKAKIPHYVPHEFRHSFCYYKAQLCENISDVAYISKICGHSISVFLNTYCNHLDTELEHKFF
jgi:integrase